MGGRAHFSREILVSHLRKQGTSFRDIDAESVHAITEEFYDNVFDVNVKGVLFTVQKALPLVPDGGSIVLTSSITAVKGDPAFSVYSASKLRFPLASRDNFHVRQIHAWISGVLVLTTQ